MVINTLTIVAVVINIVVVLLILGKIIRQLDNLVNLLKTIDKKLSGVQYKEDISASQIQRQIHDLTSKLKEGKGDVDWKG